jgi:acetyl esterase/lipase
MRNWGVGWWEIVLAVGGAILAVPLFVTWAFLVYDLGSGGGPDRWLKMCFIALLTVPVLWILGSVIARIVRRRGRDGLDVLDWLGIGGIAVFAAAVLGVAGVTARVEWTQPEPPGAFYDAPELSANAPRGQVLRSEELDGAPEGARAWRLLYISRDADDEAVAVSAILVTPEGPAPEGGRPVVAWAHGTVGVARNCAPSLRSNWAETIDGLDLFLERGYAVVATDYMGLGSEGTHPYLVGRVAAANVVDSVRSAREFGEAGAGTKYAVWGASQGGHTALFTAAAAADAPDLELVGVAAAAPPTDLPVLFDANLGTPFGNVLASFAFRTWPDTFEGVEMDQVVTWAAWPVVRNISSYCFLEEKQTLAVLPGATLLEISFIENDPVDTEPWAGLLRENSPRPGDLNVPLFVAQGEADPLVVELVTGDFVEEACDAGATVEYRTYEGVGHVPIGPEAAADAAAWIAARFEGRPPPSTCDDIDD